MAPLLIGPEIGWSLDITSVTENIYFLLEYLRFYLDKLENVKCHKLCKNHFEEKMTLDIW